MQFFVIFTRIVWHFSSHFQNDFTSDNQNDLILFTSCILTLSISLSKWLIWYQTTIVITYLPNVVMESLRDDLLLRGGEMVKPDICLIYTHNPSHLFPLLKPIPLVKDLLAWKYWKENQYRWLNNVITLKKFIQKCRTQILEF